jgi:hypothetical protein
MTNPLPAQKYLYEMINATWQRVTSPRVLHTKGGNSIEVAVVAVGGVACTRKTTTLFAIVVHGELGLTLWATHKYSIECCLTTCLNHWNPGLVSGVKNRLEADTDIALHKI